MAVLMLFRSAIASPRGRSHTGPVLFPPAIAASSGSSVNGIVTSDRAALTRRSVGNHTLRVLTPSTPFAYPQVVSRAFASFRVVKSSAYAGQRHSCSEFDSRQLHPESAGQRTKSTEHSSHVMGATFHGLGPGPRSGPA